MTMAEVNPSEKLQETELKALSQYVSDTFNDIKTVKDFLNENSKWMLLRETEFNKLVNIKKRAQKKSPELEKELAAVLEDTLSGLKQLQHFLDAVEKLAVTSVQVFQEFQDIINAAQTICPQLVEFKRDAKAFFSPKLQNVEVLAYQLDKYIKAVRQICGMGLALSGGSLSAVRESGMLERSGRFLERSTPKMPSRDVSSRGFAAGV